MIANYIKELLFEQDCVVIPDFGGFIANYVSAEIHPIRHSFSPPRKSIAFNEMLRLNDGLLASYVAQREGLSREDALLKIKDFLAQVWDELRQKNKYRLEEVGTLSLTQEQKIQFEPENRVNYFSGSFGLPELLFKPIERGRSDASAHRSAEAKRTIAQRIIAPHKTKDRPAMSNEEVYQEDDTFAGKQQMALSPRLWLFLAVPVVLLLMATTGLFLFFDDGNTVLSSFNPFTALYTPHTATRIPTEKAASANPEVPGHVPPAASVTTALDSVTQAPERGNAAGKALVTDPPTADNPPVSSSEIAENHPLAAVAEVKSVPSEATTAPSATEVSADYVAIATEIPRYYIIVGSFSKHRNALRLRKTLVSKGVTESKLIIPMVETNLHKVSYADFATFPEASAQLEVVKAAFGSQAWVFKYVK